jgi:predicted acylesterase/phospholipase RssA
VIDLESADYSQPTRTCDVVMKGGITSGVVYPHAICELAQTYRFVNVGGTSAGAIAAVATAAAEVGRDRGGFAELARLPAWLGGGKHLQELFQPQKETEGLFRMLVAALEHKRMTWFWVLITGLRRFWLGSLIGALPGAALVVLAVLSDSSALRWTALALGVLLALVGAVAGCALAAARRAMRAVPDNLYGLCSGNARPDWDAPALTPWLADLIDRCAGRTGGRPLTFGDLGSVEGLELAMITTNLTNHTALRMPWESQEYWFDEREFRRLFPKRVVDHMVANPAPLPEKESERRRTEELRERLRPLCPLPAAADLPLVVGARMSLSFPILLSAVPLHRIDWSRTANQEGDPHAERCWFTDGGASSNFPVHFFDTALPRRPTFAINLRPFHPDHPESKEEDDNVWMVDSAGGGRLEWWYPRPNAGGLFDKRLPAFFGDIVRTMQNRVDDAQLRMPGMRDRVVHVSMTKKQGGMNLTMDPAVIDRLTKRGRSAGAKLRRRFSEDTSAGEPLSWRTHRWTRLRSAMPAVGVFLADMAEAYGADLGDGQVGYRELLADGLASPYKMTDEGRAEAKALFDDVAALGARLRDAGDDLARGDPSPPLRMRMAPPE